MAKTTKIEAEPWYRREDYPRILSIMEDAVVAADLPPIYDEWVTIAERQEGDLKAKGLKAERVVIDPDEFTSYCREKHLKFDELARADFVLWKAFQREIGKP
jgi:hypothetical protein